MADENWKSVFEDETRQMVQDAFDYVDRNTDEVEKIFIFCSFEDSTIFQNLFYQINGRTVGLHQVNDALTKKTDVDDDAMWAVLDNGGDGLERIDEAMKSSEIELPKRFKMIYTVADSNLDIDFEYDQLIDPDDPRQNVQQVFDRWRAEMGGGE